jgi:hypothetical protein
MLAFREKGVRLVLHVGIPVGEEKLRDVETITFKLDLEINKSLSFTLNSPKLFMYKNLSSIKWEVQKKICDSYWNYL